MPNPKLERAVATLEKLTTPEVLEANLLRASFFLTAYELFRFSVVHQLRRAYLDYRPTMTPQEREKCYQREVCTLEPNKFGASLKWYEKEGILSSPEVAQAHKLRQLRNKVAHQLPQLLTDPEDTLSSIDIGLLWTLTARLDRWFVRAYEIPTIEELDDKEIPDNEIMSGNMAVLFLMNETLSKKRGAAAQPPPEEGLP
jgi:hypothetical protein